MDIVTYPLIPLIGPRPEAPVRQLRAMAAALPFALGTEGPWIAGGVVTKVLLGISPRAGDTDLDIVFASREQERETLDACEEAGWFFVTGESDFATTRAVGWTSEGSISLDFASLNVGPLSAILTPFDLRCCRVATDGHYLYGDAQAIQDLIDRVLFILRPTTPERVRKYLALGLDLSRVHQKEADRLYAGEWTQWTPENLTAEERLGMAPAREAGPF